MSAMASQITSPTVVYSTVYFGTDERKPQSSAPLAFVRGMHWSPVNFPQVTGEFPAQRASNAETVSIWWRHHVFIQPLTCKFHLGYFFIIQDIIISMVKVKYRDHANHCLYNKYNKDMTEMLLVRETWVKQMLPEARIIFRYQLWSILTLRHCQISVCIVRVHSGSHIYLTYLPPEQNGHHFTDDIVECIFTNKKFCILIRISPKVVPKGPIDNNAALVQVRAWRRTGDTALSEQMLLS